MLAVDVVFEYHDLVVRDAGDHNAAARWERNPNRTGAVSGHRKPVGKSAQRETLADARGGEDHPSARSPLR